MKSKIRNPFAVRALSKKAGQMKTKSCEPIIDYDFPYKPNLSKEKFLLAFEKSAFLIKETINSWYDFDEDLQENYRESIQWNLDHVNFYLNDSDQEYNIRILKSIKIFSQYKDELYNIGINYEEEEINRL